MNWKYSPMHNSYFTMVKTNTWTGRLYCVPKALKAIIDLGDREWDDNWEHWTGCDESEIAHEVPTMELDKMLNRLRLKVMLNESGRRDSREV